ncbi:hypothetical protein FHR33_008994 [Nonomuraea dietziae]|uniref:Uncharacterized protein n=1 Tax=Nonomuraea dietziae TaxID=65515 RepID=A0A7W5V9D2_9ACTN|nr:hypothetical protein [Nonomuraea dietziae]
MGIPRNTPRQDRRPGQGVASRPTPRACPVVHPCSARTWNRPWSPREAHRGTQQVSTRSALTSAHLFSLQNPGGGVAPAPGSMCRTITPSL